MQKTPATGFPRAKTCQVSARFPKSRLNLAKEMGLSAMPEPSIGPKAKGIDHQLTPSQVAAQKSGRDCLPLTTTPQH